MYPFTASACDATAYQARRLRLAQRERLQREHDWQRLLQVRPFL